MTNPLPHLGQPDVHAGALDEQLARSLQPIALAVSGLYLVAMLQRSLDASLGAPVVLAAVVPLVVFLVLGLAMSWRPMRGSLANPVLALGLALITLESLFAGRAAAGAHIHWSLIGLGAVVLRPRWGFAAAAAVVGPWLVASGLGLGGWSLGQVAFMIDVGTAATIGTVIFMARRNAVLGLVVARWDLTHLAASDPLTGLVNRRGLEQAATLAMATQPGTALQIVYLDLDGFKAVNDRLGHAEGDRALVAVAEVLRATFRSADTVGRVGGDEFLVIVAPGSDAEHAAHRLQERLAAWHDTDGRLQLRASVGTAVLSDATLEAFWAAVEGADRRMYADKAARRGMVPVIDTEVRGEPAAQVPGTAGRVLVPVLG